MEEEPFMLMSSVIIPSKPIELKNLCKSVCVILFLILMSVYVASYFMEILLFLRMVFINEIIFS